MSTVKITAVAVRTSKTDGSEFLSVTISGGLDIITSVKSGKQYFTALSCNIPMNIKLLGLASIGTELPGDVVRVKCAPYSWTNKETAEVMELSHCYRYQKSPVHPVIGEDIAVVGAGAAATIVTKLNPRLSELKAKEKLSKAEKLELIELEEA